MKDDKLTLQDTEQLCRLYMDCQLSVIEEAELRYFLSQVNYHSQLIDEVRRVMDIDTYVAEKPFVEADKSGKRLIRKCFLPVRIAASVAAILCIGIFLIRNSLSTGDSDQTYYIAYAGGSRLSNEAARIQIEEERRAADAFIKEMSALEARQKQIIENFPNVNISE